MHAAGPEHPVGLQLAVREVVDEEVHELRIPAELEFPDLRAVHHPNSPRAHGQLAGGRAVVCGHAPATARHHHRTRSAGNGIEGAALELHRKAPYASKEGISPLDS